MGSGSTITALFGRPAKVSMACAISAASRVPKMTGSTPSDGARASMVRRNPAPAVGLRRTPIRVAEGTTRDLLNILDAVGKAGAGFKSLKDAWADTTTPHGRLMLTVLGGLAEFERE